MRKHWSKPLVVLCLLSVSATAVASCSNSLGPASGTIAGSGAFQTNTSLIPGTDSGINACVAALQQILQNAGLPTLGNGTVGVERFVDALRTGWASQPYGTATNGSPGQRGSIAIGVTQSQAVQGDIVVQGDGYLGNDGENHVGICENNGCTMILSNASRSDPSVSCVAPCFGWEATSADYQNAFNPVNPSGYYHLAPY